MLNWHACESYAPRCYWDYNSNSARTDASAVTAAKNNTGMFDDCFVLGMLYLNLMSNILPRDMFVVAIFLRSKLFQAIFIKRC